jgi:hypothetical protein
MMIILLKDDDEDDIVGHKRINDYFHHFISLAVINSDRSIEFITDPGYNYFRDIDRLLIKILFINLFMYSSIYLSIHPSIYSSIYVSINLSIYLSIYLSIFLFIYPSFHLTICSKTSVSLLENLPVGSFIFRPQEITVNTVKVCAFMLCINIQCVYYYDTVVYLYYIFAV